MLKYRTLIIFGAALVFALHTVVFSDAVSLAAMLVLLSGHYIDRFFGAERLEVKIEAAALARITALEEEAKKTKEDIGHLKLSQGMRART